MPVSPVSWLAGLFDFGASGKDVPSCWAALMGAASGGSYPKVDPEGLLSSAGALRTAASAVDEHTSSLQRSMFGLSATSAGAREMVSATAEGVGEGARGGARSLREGAGALEEQALQVDYAQWSMRCTAVMTLWMVAQLMWAAAATAGASASLIPGVLAGGRRSVMDIVAQLLAESRASTGLAVVQDAGIQAIEQGKYRRRFDLTSLWLAGLSGLAGGLGDPVGRGLGNKVAAPELLRKLAGGALGGVVGGEAGAVVSAAWEGQWDPSMFGLAAAAGAGTGLIGGGLHHYTQIKHGMNQGAGPEPLPGPEQRALPPAVEQHHTAVEAPAPPVTTDAAPRQAPSTAPAGEASARRGAVQYGRQDWRSHEPNWLRAVENAQKHPLVREVQDVTPGDLHTWWNALPKTHRQRLDAVLNTIVATARHPAPAAKIPEPAELVRIRAAFTGELAVRRLSDPHTTVQQVVTTAHADPTEHPIATDARLKTFREAAERQAVAADRRAGGVFGGMPDPADRPGTSGPSHAEGAGASAPAWNWGTDGPLARHLSKSGTSHQQTHALMLEHALRLHAKGTSHFMTGLMLGVTSMQLDGLLPVDSGTASPPTPAPGPRITASAHPRHGAPGSSGVVRDTAQPMDLDRPPAPTATVSSWHRPAIDAAPHPLPKPTTDRLAHQLHRELSREEVATPTVLALLHQATVGPHPLHPVAQHFEQSYHQSLTDALSGAHEKGLLTDGAHALAMDAAQPLPPGDLNRLDPDVFATDLHQAIAARDEREVNRLLRSLQRTVPQVFEVEDAYGARYASTLRNELESSFPEHGKYFTYLLGHDNGLESKVIGPMEAEQWHAMAARATFTDELGEQRPVPFGLPEDGCYARAHLVSTMLSQAGVFSRKVFVVKNHPTDNLMVESEFVWGAMPGIPGTVHWGYHVATVVLVDDGAWGHIETVIDPSLSPGPQPLKRWLASMGVHSPARINGFEADPRGFLKDPDRFLRGLAGRDGKPVSSGGLGTLGYPKDVPIVFTAARTHWGLPKEHSPVLEGEESSSLRHPEKRWKTRLRLVGDHAAEARYRGALRTVRTMLRQPHTSDRQLEQHLRDHPFSARIRQDPLVTFPLRSRLQDPVPPTTPGDLPPLRIERSRVYELPPGPVPPLHPSVGTPHPEPVTFRSGAAAVDPATAAVWKPLLDNLPVRENLRTVVVPYLSADGTPLSSTGPLTLHDFTRLAEAAGWQPGRDLRVVFAALHPGATDGYDHLAWTDYLRQAAHELDQENLHVDPRSSGVDIYTVGAVMPGLRFSPDKHPDAVDGERDFTTGNGHWIRVSTHPERDPGFSTNRGQLHPFTSNHPAFARQAAIDTHALPFGIVPGHREHADGIDLRSPRSGPADPPALIPQPGLFTVLLSDYSNVTGHPHTAEPNGPYFPIGPDRLARTLRKNGYRGQDLLWTAVYASDMRNKAVCYVLDLFVELGRPDIYVPTRNSFSLQITNYTLQFRFAPFGGTTGFERLTATPDIPARYTAFEGTLQLRRPTSDIPATPDSPPSGAAQAGDSVPRTQPVQRQAAIPPTPHRSMHLPGVALPGPGPKHHSSSPAETMSKSLRPTQPTAQPTAQPREFSTLVASTRAAAANVPDTPRGPATPQLHPTAPATDRPGTPQLRRLIDRAGIVLGGPDVEAHLRLAEDLYNAAQASRSDAHDPLAGLRRSVFADGRGTDAQLFGLAETLGDGGSRVTVENLRALQALTHMLYPGEAPKLSPTINSLRVLTTRVLHTAVPGTGDIQFLLDIAEASRDHPRLTVPVLRQAAGKRLPS